MATVTPTTETTLVLRRTFAAPQSKVFHAWTDPRHLKRWFAPSDDFEVSVAEVDLRVGGKYRIGMKPADKEETYIVIGEYREIDAPRRLVYSWAWEGDQETGETIVTVEFRAVGAGTELMLKHEFFPNPDARRRHEEGWSGCLDRFARLLKS
jgi:uncharacterized protein YndB with AHSA1/START domain